MHKIKFSLLYLFTLEIDGAHHLIFSLLYITTIKSCDAAERLILRSSQFKSIFIYMRFLYSLKMGVQ